MIRKKETDYEESFFYQRTSEEQQDPTAWCSTALKAILLLNQLRSSSHDDEQHDEHESHDVTVSDDEDDEQSGHEEKESKTLLRILKEILHDLKKSCRCFHCFPGCCCYFRCLMSLRSSNRWKQMPDPYMALEADDDEQPHDAVQFHLLSDQTSKSLNMPSGTERDDVERIFLCPQLNSKSDRTLGQVTFERRQLERDTNSLEHNSHVTTIDTKRGKKKAVYTPHAVVCEEEYTGERRRRRERGVHRRGIRRVSPDSIGSLQTLTCLAQHQSLSRECALWVFPASSSLYFFPKDPKRISSLLMLMAEKREISLPLYFSSFSLLFLSCFPFVVLCPVTFYFPCWCSLWTHPASLFSSFLSLDLFIALSFAIRKIPDLFLIPYPSS